MIIGVASTAVVGVHAAKALALAYVTYYQSADPGTFISSEKDVPSVGFFSDGQHLQSTLDPGWDVLCANSAVFRQRVVKQLNSLLNDHYDGLFIDNTIASPAATDTCTAPHAHVNPGERGDDSYLSLLAEVRSALQQASPNAIIITNPGNPVWADQLGTGIEPSLWQSSDLVLWESYGYTSDTGSEHDDWQNTLTSSYTYAADPTKSSKILALSYPQNISEALFSFSGARMFGFRWTANLRVNGTSGHFGEFTSSMPSSVGQPQGPLVSHPGLLARQFSNGIAYANTGTSTVSVTISQAGTIMTARGAQAATANSSVSLAPDNAAVLLLQ